jgi:hypothetical protein
MDTGPEPRHPHAIRWSHTRERLICRWNLNDCGAPEMIWTRLIEERDGSSLVDAHGFEDELIGIEAGPHES